MRWILHIFVITPFILKESSFLSWTCRLFRSIFTPNPGDVLNWSLLVNDMQLYKRLQICDNKRLKRKKCSWSYQRNKTSLAKRLSKNFRFRIRIILVIESFFNKNWRPWLQALNMIFFTIAWRATSMDKFILTYKYSWLLPI